MRASRLVAAAGASACLTFMVLTSNSSRPMTVETVFTPVTVSEPVVVEFESERNPQIQPALAPEETLVASPPTTLLVEEAPPVQVSEEPVVIEETTTTTTAHISVHDVVRTPSTPPSTAPPTDSEYCPRDGTVYATGSCEVQPGTMPGDPSWTEAKVCEGDNHESPADYPCDYDPATWTCTDTHYSTCTPNSEP